MTDKPRYPQRPFFRSILRLLGRLLIPLLGRVDIRGLERFPSQGPLIVVGNHTGALEVVLLTVYAPRIVEYLGSVDIPHEGYIAAFINAYGFIPVFRGNADRSSMEACLEVLRQGKVLGLFPEGGIWEPAIRRSQAGVAWLSYHGKAPVLPIGFGSMRGALAALLRLKRPTLTMHVGELLPAIQLIPGRSRKQQLQEAADRIVDGIWSLVPEEEQTESIPIADESFAFEVEILDRDGVAINHPESLTLVHGSSLCKVLHRATLFNNFLNNLQLPVSPLKVLHTHPPLEDLLTATNAILGYLEKENSYYFTYRYGLSEGTAMRAGIQEFHDLIEWVQDQNYSLRATPIRSYRRTDTGEIVKHHIPQEEDKW